jgi:uncharacterized protein YpmB
LKRIARKNRPVTREIIIIIIIIIIIVQFSSSVLNSSLSCTNANYKASTTAQIEQKQ